MTKHKTENQICANCGHERSLHKDDGKKKNVCWHKSGNYYDCLKCKEFVPQNQSQGKAREIVSSKTAPDTRKGQTPPTKPIIKKSDNWRSPDWIMALFPFFDPCPINAKIDGLSIDWEDKTYVNPPYSNPKPWVIKAIEENKKGKMIVILLPVDTTTEWYKLLYQAGAHFLFPNERLRFNGSSTPARWGCLIAVLE